jgi:hypothetical protein
MDSVIVSGLGTSPWARSHFEPVTGPSFSQAPLHFHLCNSFRQEQVWVRDVTVKWQLTWCPVFLLEEGSVSSLSLLSRISCKFPHFESWESPTFQVSGAFWGVPPPNLLFPEVVCLHSFCWPSGLQPFTLTQGSGFPLSPITSPHPVDFPSQIPPSFPTCNCFLLSTKWVWGVINWALYLVELFEFCGLYLGYSVNVKSQIWFLATSLCAQCYALSSQWHFVYLLPAEFISFSLSSNLTLPAVTREAREMPCTQRMFTKKKYIW